MLRIEYEIEGMSKKINSLPFIRTGICPQCKQKVDLMAFRDPFWQKNFSTLTIMLNKQLERGFDLTILTLMTYPLSLCQSCRDVEGITDE